MHDRRRFLQDVFGAGAAAWAALLPPAAVRLPRPRAPATTPPPELHSDQFVGAQPGQAREVEGVELRWCPAGSFSMGSPPGEVGRRADEAQVAVTLTRGFWIGTYEVTQAQWRRFVGSFPGRQPSTRFGKGDDWPAYWVSFVDAERFCAGLTERARRSGALPGAWEFRPPTEAQWEYACRAGTRTASAFGDRLGRDEANFGGEPLNGGRAGPPLGRAARVGSYPANGWGICDMHGNVFEWCRDWYHGRLPGGVDPDLYDVPGVRNRDGTFSRVRRGGAWNDDGWACRSALRLRYEPERSSDHIGFRVAAVRA